MMHSSEMDAKDVWMDVKEIIGLRHNYSSELSFEGGLNLVFEMKTN